MKFSTEQIGWLKADLLRENVAQRNQAGRSLSYIEGWHAIAEANRIFGFDGWCSETVDIRMVAERERDIRGTQGWGVSYVARVRITVGSIVREGIGSGHGIDRDLGLAHESAIKEAETDARKRALMTFGNQFGLALYDKTQANVSDEQPKPQVSQPAGQPSGGSLSQPKKEEASGASNPVSVRSDPSAATRPAQSRVAAIPSVAPTQSKAAAVLEKPYSGRVSGNLMAAVENRHRAVMRGVANLDVTSKDHAKWAENARECWHEMTGIDQRRVKAAQKAFEADLAKAIAARDAGANPRTGELPLAAE